MKVKAFVKETDDQVYCPVCKYGYFLSKNGIFVHEMYCALCGYIMNFVADINGASRLYFRTDEPDCGAKDGDA